MGQETQYGQNAANQEKYTKTCNRFHILHKGNQSMTAENITRVSSTQKIYTNNQQFGNKQTTQ